MTTEMPTNPKLDKEKIEVFKHFLNELLEDPESNYSESILKIIKLTNDVIIGNKELGKVSDKQYFYVEFLLNYRNFFKKFENSEITVESIKPYYKELFDIFNSWKSQSEVISELNDKYMRLFAEFDNYKKRMAKEKIEDANELKFRMNKDIITILDDLTLAKVSLSNEAKSGIDIIFNKFELYLNNMSIHKVEIVKGDTFNSDISECIATVPSNDVLDGQIVDILRTTWSIDGRVVRFGQVVVCRN